MNSSISVYQHAKAMMNVSFLSRLSHSINCDENQEHRKTLDIKFHLKQKITHLPISNIFIPRTWIACQKLFEFLTTFVYCWLLEFSPVIWISTTFVYCLNLYSTTFCAELSTVEAIKIHLVWVVTSIPSWLGTPKVFSPLPWPNDLKLLFLPWLKFPHPLPL